MCDRNIVMDFFVRTKLNNVFRYISFNEIEIESTGGNKELFLDAVIKKGELRFKIINHTTYLRELHLFSLALIAHNVQSECILSIDLVDEYGMPIHDDNIFIIKQFKNCSHFFVEIRAKYRQNDLDTLIEVSVSFFCGYVFMCFCCCAGNFHFHFHFHFQFRASQIICDQMMGILF